MSAIASPAAYAAAGVSNRGCVGRRSARPPVRLHFGRQQAQRDRPAGVVVAAGTGLFELIEGPLQDGAGQDVRDRLENAREHGWQPRLLGIEQFLVELLAGAQSDNLDIDIEVGLQAGEPDHAPRDIDHPNRIAHVEHEDAPAAHLFAKAARGAVQDELHRLVHRHEEALDVRDA